MGTEPSACGLVGFFVGIALGLEDRSVGFVVGESTVSQTASMASMTDP